MVAPVVPGLTDHEIPAILKAARDAGAHSAGYITLRLPYGVKDLFSSWLERHFPDRKDKVLNRVRELRDGKLYDPTFGVRMRGEGVFADQIEALFDTTARKLGLTERHSRRSGNTFRRPAAAATARGAQLGLFE